MTSRAFVALPPVRVAPALALLVVGGCDGCWPSAGKDTTPIETLAPPSPAPPPVVDQLRIVPDEVHAPAGSAFRLSVRAWNPAGERVPVPSGLSWSANAFATFAGNDPVLVTLLPEANGAIVVTVSSGMVTSPSATILVPATGPGDRLDLPHQPGTPPEATLLDACEGADSIRDSRAILAGEANLGRNLTSDCTTSPEVAVFSTQRGALLETAPFSSLGSVPPWSAAASDVLSRPALPTTRTVDVWLHVRTASDAAQATYAEAEIEGIANGIFSAARAGVSFQVAGTTSGTGAVDADKSICGDAGKLAAIGADVGVQRLHVVVLAGLQGGYRGWTCPPSPYQQGRAILVDTTRSPTTIAHELGHALALDAPLGSYGHTGSDFHNMVGFEYPNLMWIGDNIESTLPRTGLTLGQVFRMNFDGRSWLAQVGAGPSRSCQCEHYLAGVCPLLHLDVVDPLPKPGSPVLCVP